MDKYLQGLLYRKQAALNTIVAIEGLLKQASVIETQELPIPEKGWDPSTKTGLAGAGLGGLAGAGLGYGAGHLTGIDPNILAALGGLGGAAAGGYGGYKLGEELKKPFVPDLKINVPLPSAVAEPSLLNDAYQKVRELDARAGQKVRDLYSGYNRVTGNVGRLVGDYWGPKMGGIKDVVSEYYLGPPSKEPTYGLLEYLDSLNR